jgi:hypothetical protein
VIKYVLAKSPEKAILSFSRTKSALVFDTEEKCKSVLDEVGSCPYNVPPWSIYRVSHDVGKKPTATHIYTQEEE